MYPKGRLSSTVIVYVYSDKKDKDKQIGNSGFMNKKIVITTHRMMVFECLSNRLQETEYELTTTVAKKPVGKGREEELNERRSRISVNGVPEVEVDVLGL